MTLDLILIPQVNMQTITRSIRQMTTNAQHKALHTPYVVHEDRGFLHSQVFASIIGGFGALLGMWLGAMYGRDLSKWLNKKPNGPTSKGEHPPPLS